MFVRMGIYVQANQLSWCVSINHIIFYSRMECHWNDQQTNFVTNKKLTQEANIMIDII